MKKHHVDIVLYLSMGMLIVFLNGMTGDEAAKYIPPFTLFLLKNISATLAAGMLTLKALIDPSFTEGSARAKAEENPFRYPTVDPAPKTGT